MNEAEQAGGPASDAGSPDLRNAAPLFTALWLADVLSRVLNPNRPTLVNSDGDEISFQSVRYPLLAGTTPEQVRERLSTIEALRDAGGSVWNWVENDGAAVARPRSAPESDGEMTLGVTLDDGDVVSGTVALVDGAVVLSTNSSARAERGRDLLTPRLAGLVDAAVTEVESVEDAAVSRPEDDPSPSDDIPDDVLARIVHDSLDRHYRATLDQPVGMLGHRTPRACARSEAGRVRVVDWLKSLERDSGRVGRNEDDPMRSYDFGWMWDELGVADLRR